MERVCSCTTVAMASRRRRSSSTSTRCITRCTRCSSKPSGNCKATGAAGATGVAGALSGTANAATTCQPRVMAHYMPCFPTSLDNLPTAQDYYQTQYLQPSGENYRYAKTGGYLRDRPMGVPVASGNWRVVNATREVATVAARRATGLAQPSKPLQPDSRAPQAVDRAALEPASSHCGRFTARRAVRQSEAAPAMD